MNNTDVTLSSVLKEQTHDAHQALEAVVVRKIKAIKSKEDYERLLYKFYGFHQPLEQWFDKLLDNDIVPFYAKRRRSGLILNDLANLGHENVLIPLTNELPFIDSLAKALGAFYVLEGSTNGGTIVANMLINYAGMTTDTTTFFYAYGDDKSLWKSFRDKINTYTAESDFSEEMVTAANETFLKFRDWILK
jgi:heme oxygenase (biliverdin-IX-beta and delta-forming)